MEFSRYLVDLFTKLDVSALDPHFKPQYLHCPFCLEDFSFIGHLENFSDDYEYLLHTLGLSQSKELSLIHI